MHNGNYVREMWSGYQEKMCMARTKFGGDRVGWMEMNIELLRAPRTFLCIHGYLEYRLTFKNRHSQAH